MLSQLTIRNFALIDQLTIDFQQGLNILTGETGAGKSILIDALRYTLGGKLNTSQIRRPEQPSVIEAVFDISPKILTEFPALSDYLADGETNLIINRTYNNDGRQKNKINGLNVTLAQLRELGNHLVDFHGPNDHQQLLSPSSHLAIIDRLSNLNKLKTTYTEKYLNYQALQQKALELEKIANSREREIDLFSYQLKELEQVPLDAKQYRECMEEQTRLQNTEGLCRASTELINILEGNEYGISELLGRAFSSMRTLTDTDQSTAPLAELLSQLKENNEELLQQLRNYLDRLAFDPDTARAINTRGDIYTDLLRKYGPTIEQAGAYYREIKEKYTLLTNLENNQAELKKNIAAKRKDATTAAKKISERRVKTAQALKVTIEKELSELGIKKVKFDCRVGKTELNPDGYDSVEFYISPNVGEELKPLAEIVSSGEAARVMLALKKALIKVDPVPVLIFDEIDAQIGGRLGTITGRKLREISRNRQVILITHLPQIASFADTHYRVFKTAKNNRTNVNITLLEEELRTKELAKMMSGERESKISLQHAHTLLNQARTA